MLPVVHVEKFSILPLLGVREPSFGGFLLVFLLGTFLPPCMSTSPLQSPFPFPEVPVAASGVVEKVPEAPAVEPAAPTPGVQLPAPSMSLYFAPPLPSLFVFFSLFS